MAKIKPRKLKVFQAQFGFYDTVVAAPSRAAALRAWGTHQDLFASGEAEVTSDAFAVAAATAHPETPLRRAIGSTEAFALEPTSLPTIPDGPSKGDKKATSKAKSEVFTKAPADRSTLDAAEGALKRLDEDRRRDEANFRAEAQQLEARRTAAKSAYVEAREIATTRVVNARSAYREAGGKN